MLDIVPTLFDEGYDLMYESNPSFCIKASAWKLWCAGSSGGSICPSRYWITCRMLGLAHANGCEHSSPSFSARCASLTLYCPLSLISIASSSDPCCTCSSAQSTNMTSSSCVLCMIGLCPQVTSRINTPKANTSVRGVPLPVRASSGAMYPMVPATRVVPCSTP
uniref:Uncharacterized protein n=1 Tax=Triticum urartu TaxID=4572 RepID=A0A8R7UWP4_TRIUA